MTFVDETPEGKLQRCERLCEAVSDELLISQEVYIKKIMMMRFYLKCLLSDLEHLPDNKNYSNYLHKVRLRDIRIESLKKG